MPEKDPKGFTVSDRRLFTEEGERRPDVAENAAEEAPAQPPAPQPPASAAPPAIDPSVAPDATPSAHPAAQNAPPPPTEAEQQASSQAYSGAHAALDGALHDALGEQHRPESLKATFESFIASLYMSAMMQLGLLHERGEQPQVDLVGARHTIDTLTMLEEKTRGNLSENEKALLQDCLFRLRMAFVEMTNALTRAPQPSPPPGKK